MPTDTFSITASGDDGEAKGVGTSYPPSATSAPTTGISIYPQRSFATPNYTIGVALLRFDTSALPDDATITGATLRIEVTFRPSVDARSLTAEWYDAGTIGTDDYTSTVGTDAHAGTLLSSLLIDINNLALTNVSNVSLTGITGLRLHISGGAPTGTNSVEMTAFDDPTFPEPQLLVTYTVAPVFRFDTSQFPKAMMRSAVPVPW